MFVVFKLYLVYKKINKNLQKEKKKKKKKKLIPAYILC